MVDDVPEVVCRGLDELSRRGTDRLCWGYPEPWVQTELYALLRGQQNRTEWIPMPTEIPYVTRTPVRLPKATNRDWRSDGAVKWSDLCLYNNSKSAWWWIELKVRAIDADRIETGTRDAFDAIRKDVVGLLGFDRTRTADLWRNPDAYSRAYWFDNVLRPRAESVENGEHRFLFAFLQPGGQVSGGGIDGDQIRRDAEEWWRQRTKHMAEIAVMPSFEVSLYELQGASAILATAQLS